MKNRKLVLMMLAIISILLILLGIFINNELTKTILIAIGGSILGASISDYLANTGYSIYEVLNNSAVIPFLKNGKDINILRRKFYIYYITKENDQIQWRLIIENYNNNFSNTYLISLNNLLKDDKSRIAYNTIGLLFESRYIMISNANSGTEKPGIYIFNKSISEYCNTYVGYGVFENWDGIDMYAPIIMSKEPISGIVKTGLISSEHFPILNQIVKRDIPDMIDISSLIMQNQ